MKNKISSISFLILSIILISSFMNRKNNYDHFRDNAIAGYDYRNLFELPIGNYNMKVGPERNLQSFYEIIKMLEDTKIELKHNGFKEYKNSVNNLEHNLGKLKKAAFEETYDVNDWRKS